MNAADDEFKVDRPSLNIGSMVFVLMSLFIVSFREVSQSPITS